MRGLGGWMGRGIMLEVVLLFSQVYSSISVRAFDCVLYVEGYVERHSGWQDSCLTRFRVLLINLVGLA